MGYVIFFIVLTVAGGAVLAWLGVKAINKDNELQSETTQLPKTPVPEKQTI